MKSGKLLLVLCTCSTIAFSMEESIVPPASTEASLDQVARVAEIVETVAPAVAEQLADAPVQASGWMNVGSRVFGYCSSQIGRATSGLARGITKGSWNTMRFLVKPEVRKTEIVVAGAAAIWGITRAAANRARLYEKAHQCGLYRMPLKWGLFGLAFLKKNSDMYRKSSNKIKIYNWKLRKYPTVAAIKEGAAREVISAMLEGLETSRSQNNAEQINVLLKLIKAGIQELENMLGELADYACFPKKYDLIGIEKIINDCCLELDDKNGDDLGTIQKAFDANELLAKDEGELDELVKNAIEKKWIHLITLRPNLGLAAKIYWETLKRLKRLQAINGVVVSSYSITPSWQLRR